MQKLIDLEFSNIDPMKDIQNYIVKNSSFTDNDRLRKLYKELGLFVPLHDEVIA